MGGRKSIERAILSRPALYLVPAAALHPSHRGERLRAAARAALYVVRTILFRRPSVVRMGRSSKVIARPGEFNPLHAVIRNPPNTEMAVWRRHLKPGDTFIDVGANIGLYTIYALECGASVVAIEPDPVNAERVRENLRANGADAVVVAKALDREPGTVTMTTDLNERNHLLPAGSDGQTVEATTLDDVIGDRTVMVKIDVEGAEEAVLHGASRALSERRITLMQLEWGLDEGMTVEDRAALLDLLASHDYRMLENDRDGNLTELGDRAPSGLNIFVMPAELVP
ncbi:FkbM family methyltransferase [Nocardioides bizhenqiangii]|uniref:FkbM family methyltransferase n=1 Tax=Nocardioides bizhenqiangii TaxID=3095076 RepID=A0ABZ0ZNR9_9ACTN|nr:MULTISPECIES: FkbM family methyltransferase [unclassified Nocardioides]MDZ5620039.1 FkbM family methyltransferase [Nocardioides sp. HM23]WQQ25959.1 FkbM family methyltransferase [Nocardioides sp. HM61]